MKQGYAPRSLCPRCGTEDDVVVVAHGPDAWRYTCSADTRHHAEPVSWTVDVPDERADRRSGIGAELGVYDVLLDCIRPGEVVEYGVVEHRFAALAPHAYRELVGRYGHASLADTRYSASMFLAGALGQLRDEGLLRKSVVKGTGYWSYLSTVSAWALASEPAGSIAVSWEQYAGDEGLDPTSWAFAAAT